MNFANLFQILVVFVVGALGVCAIGGVLYAMFILGNTGDSKSLNDTMGDRVDAATAKKEKAPQAATSGSVPASSASSADLADIRAAQADAVIVDPRQLAALAREERTDGAGRIEPTMSAPVTEVTPMVTTVSEVSAILARAQARNEEASDTPSVPVLNSAPNVPAPERQAAAMEKEESTLAEFDSADRPIPDHLRALIDREMPNVGSFDSRDSFSPSFRD